MNTRRLLPEMIFITVMVVVLIFLLVITVAKHKPSIRNMDLPDGGGGGGLKHFSVPIQFDPYPQPSRVISNDQDCTAETLKVCRLDDVTTNFGCKELLVKCQHFDVDTPFVNNVTNTTTIIPKNVYPHEGYALAITAIADGCNPYHGDMTLISTNPSSTEYMLVCSCKNPGYVGNESLLGNCSTAYICNGKIDSIDQPLNKIKCLCADHEKNMRYSDGLPVCKEMTVKDANEKYPDDWSHLLPWKSYRHLPITKFNPTIAGNLRTSHLLDPCRNSLHDTSIEIRNGEYNSINGECNFTNYGYPVSNGMLDFHPTEGTNNGKPEPKQTSVDAALATEQYSFIRVTDNVGGQRKIYGVGVDGLPFDENLRIAPMVMVPPAGISLGANNALNITARPKLFYAPQCKGTWPSYRCNYDDYYTHDFLGLPLSGSRPVPFGFPFGTEYWTQNEDLLRTGLVLSTRGITFNNEELLKNSSEFYGLQWASRNTEADANGILVFKDPNDYRIHVANMN